MITPNLFLVSTSKLIQVPIGTMGIFHRSPNGLRSIMGHRGRLFNTKSAKVTVPLSDKGPDLTLETGKLARFADGCATGTLGATTVLVAAIACNLLAVDGVYDPDVLSINAASTALAVSDIPWNGPIGAVRLGYIDDQVVVNPSRLELKRSGLNMVLVGRKKGLVMMVEMEGREVELSLINKAVHTGIQSVQNICDQILHLQKEVGKPKRPVELAPITPNIQLINSTTTLAETLIRHELQNFSHDKISRDVAIRNVGSVTIDKLQESFPDEPVSHLQSAFDFVRRETFRNLIFETGIRCDGRRADELRPISSSVDIFPPVHGSALFQRGQTQVLTTVTFDSAESAFRSDPVSALTGALKEKKFMLHYEFPQYAVNELGGRVVGRRELGHGALAEKALRPLIPTDFPFTIRLTCEVLESNGSSSMASVCGGSLALMDAGVPIPKPAGGVAIGLVSKYDSDDMDSEIKDYKILTDLSGIEDYAGDMDFKVAGTNQGFTAMQLDLKIPGIPVNIMIDALEAAEKGKTAVLNKMAETLDTPRRTLKEGGPVTEAVKVKPEHRARFIGMGGYNLKKITSEFGVTLTPDEDGGFNIFAPNPDAMEEAKDAITKLLQAETDTEKVLDFGGIYTAKIVEIRDMGVMVKLYPNMTPTLIPNSQLDQRRVSHASALGLEVGNEISVKYFGREPTTGRIRLSRKILQVTSDPGTKYLLNEESKVSFGASKPASGNPWSVAAKKKN